MRNTGVRLVSIVVLLTVVVGIGTGQGAGLRRHGDGWLLDPGVLLEPSPASTTGGGSWVRWMVGQGQLFGMPELPLLACAVTVGRGEPAKKPRGPSRWRLQVRWQRLGGAVFREDRWDAALLRDGRWRVGVRGGRETLLLAGEAGPAHGDLTAQVGRRWTWPGGIEGRCDVHLPLDNDAPDDTRRVRPVARLALRHGGVAGLVAWDRRLDGTPLAGGEIVVALAPSFAVQWRLDGASGSFGPGLSVRRGGLILRTSHVVHPDLGATHRWQLIVGMGRTASGGGP